jgi:ATP-dependent Clp protease ATP-binding subunit ClpC
MVEQSSIPETVEIIQGLRKKMEQHYRGQVKITDEAIEAAAVLSHRYISDRFLPDKAIDLVDEAASAAAMALAEAVEPAAQCQIGKAEIEVVVHKITGVPLGDMREGESAKLLEMEKTLHQQVVGQHPAITAVSRAVRRARAGLKDPNKPIGSFLFLGPTGVGKTELARALQQFLFSNDDLIRLDMSEYQERHTVARLIGSPPGYVGFDEGGQLTEKVRRKPYSVVLLDEIEKAHPDVFNLLLQIMDDGHLTDGQGNTVDFKNVILIMTSNVGGHTLMSMPLEMFSTTGEVPEAVQSALRYTFSPEFLNRIDRVVTFHRLLREHLDLIIEKLVGGLRALLANRKVSLSLTGGAKDLILKKGWNEEYGARPLKRAIDQMLADELSDLILRGEAPEGSEIEVSLTDQPALFFQVKEPVSEAAAMASEAS